MREGSCQVRKLLGSRGVVPLVFTRWVSAELSGARLEGSNGFPRRHRRKRRNIFIGRVQFTLPQQPGERKHSVISMSVSPPDRTATGRDLTPVMARGTRPELAEEAHIWPMVTVPQVGPRPPRWPGPSREDRRGPRP